MNIMSLFDGISCGRVALERANLTIDNYYASEIDKYAIQIAKKNYPNTIHLGDVNNIDFKQFTGKIDLLMGGSPCQGFSRAGKGLNFDDPRSKLFFKYAEALEIIKPKFFLLENVVMEQEWVNIISNYLQVNPVLINSSLISAHDRKRLYWTNIPGITQPEDKNICLQDIFDYHIQTEWEKKFNILGNNKTISTYLKVDRKGNLKKNQLKASCLTGGHRGDGNHSDMDLILFNDGKARRYSPIECERLQTLPDNYTEGVSNTQRYKSLANGWTVDVVAHIFSNLATIYSVNNEKQPQYIVS